MPLHQAAIDDLYQVEGQAELINGNIVQLPLHGHWPGYALCEILVSLRGWIRGNGLPGLPVSSTGAFVVDLPHRKSFCADAGYYEGPNSGMKFFDGAPRFAVEMRDEKDYGPSVDEARAAKRQDYFAAGTLVVWDVALLDDYVVRVYRNNVADVPAATYKRGEIAEAEPAVPGWTMPVDELFE